MPLIDRTSQYVASRPGLLADQHRQHIPQELTSHGETPTHKPTTTRVRQEDSDASSDDQASNPLGARDIVPFKNDRHHKALAMKFNVPSTIAGSPNTLSNQVGLAVGKRGLQLRTESEGRSLKSAQAGRKSTFDDTESFNFDDEVSQHEFENHTVVFRGDRTQDVFNPRRVDYLRQYPPPTTNSTTASQSRGFDNIRRDLPQHEHAPEKEDLRVHHNAYWEKKRGHSPANKSDRATEQAEKTFAPTLSPDHTAAAPTQVKVSTGPNKTVCFQSPPTGTQHLDRADSPELLLPSERAKLDLGTKPVGSLLLGRSNTNSTAEPDARDGPVALSVSTSSGTGPAHGGAIESARTSDCPTSSEDETAPVRSKPTTSMPQLGDNPDSLKRYRDEDIDFGGAALRNMKYDDLTREEFERNEKTLSNNVAFDTQGNPLTLPQRLTNLSRMSEDEQKSMFRSQGDEEWAQIGSWFIDQFQEGLQRLMDVKIERRKISMRFEDEIRRRQKVVEQRCDNVEEELRNLKKGGGELIKGRETPSRRGTPQRRPGH